MSDAYIVAQKLRLDAPVSHQRIKQKYALGVSIYNGVSLNRSISFSEGILEAMRLK